MEILQQLSETIDNFRYFTEPPKTEMEFDVKDIIEKSITLISPSFKLSFIQLENKLEKDCYLYGSPREFSSILLNILNNARDTLERKKIANPKVKIKLSQVEEKVVIKISDNAG